MDLPLIEPNSAGAIASMVALGSFMGNMILNPALHGVGTVDPFKLKIPKKTRSLLEKICHENHEPFQDIPFLSGWLYD